MASNNPVIVVDRCKVEDLEKDHPLVLQRLHEHGIGKTEAKKGVQFCGLSWAGETESYIFLPRMSGSGILEEDLKTAKLTMTVLAQYGREQNSRTGMKQGEHGNTGLLAVITDLALDFRGNGIYAERTRYRSRNSGKPDWPRTVVRELAFTTNGKNPVYPEMRTTRSVDSHENPLARIQAAVLGEILEHHGWWLEGSAKRKIELNQYKPPNTPRALWAHNLRQLLPGLYAARAISLANLLISYLENNRGQASGSFLYGVEDFHTLWEHMLRQVLNGVEGQWNQDLPVPAYFHKGENRFDKNQGMRTDIIIRNGNKIVVVDAKYYDASTTGKPPGWGDIVKQLFYEFAIRGLLKEDETVSGCFVFPQPTGQSGAYSHVAILDTKDHPVSRFPDIGCVYLDIKEIMNLYVARNKRDLPLEEH